MLVSHHTDTRRLSWGLHVDEGKHSAVPDVSYLGWTHSLSIGGGHTHSRHGHTHSHHGHTQTPLATHRWRRARTKSSTVWKRQRNGRSRICRLLSSRDREKKGQRRLVRSVPPRPPPPFCPVVSTAQERGLLHTSKSCSWLYFSSPWLYLYWHESRVSYFGDRDAVSRRKRRG